MYDKVDRRDRTVDAVAQDNQSAEGIAVLSAQTTERR